MNRDDRSSSSLLLRPFASWAVAPSDYATPGQAGPPPASSFTDETLRYILRTSIGGEQARVRFSNVYGVAPLRIDGAHIAIAKSSSEIDVATDRALTVDGRAAFTVAAGAEVWSDPATLPVPANADVAVSVFVKSEAAVRTWHAFARQTNTVGRGNRLSAATMAGDDGGALETIEACHWVTGLDVHRREATNVVVVIGDSNIDGYGSTVDGNQRFTNHLSKRFAAESAAVGVINAGLSGNRVSLDGPIGEAATKRFARDVLGQSGVSHVIVHLGINDIGLCRLIPTQCPSTDDIIAALDDVVSQATAKNLKVILGTLLPWWGATLFGASYFDAAGEAKRVAINNWIRNADVHAVVDFDRAVGDPADATRIAARLDSGDHLHCNDAGYEAMARAVDLSKFR